MAFISWITADVHFDVDDSVPAVMGRLIQASHLTEAQTTVDDGAGGSAVTAQDGAL